MMDEYQILASSGHCFENLGFKLYVFLFNLLSLFT